MSWLTRVDLPALGVPMTATFRNRWSPGATECEGVCGVRAWGCVSPGSSLLSSITTSTGPFKKTHFVMFYS